MEMSMKKVKISLKFLEEAIDEPLSSFSRWLLFLVLVKFILLWFEVIVSCDDIWEILTI